MVLNMKLALLTCIFICILKNTLSFDPNAVSHTSKNQLKASQSQSESGMGPFHYGSHYSNSGTVLHYLARLPPFTEMSLSYQDGNFDLPDRMFHNMKTSWYLASKGSSTDVKELIPLIIQNLRI